MSTELVTLRRDESVKLAKDVSHLGRIGHLPVVEGETVVGIVSLQDVLEVSLTPLMHGEKVQRIFLEGVSVESVMSTPPTTISPDASIQEAAQLMVEKRIGCLPVVEHGRLVGLVTETDILRIVAGLE
jgi:CBS domain-containing protein